MNLKPGDMLYYGGNRATGILIRKSGSKWIYHLRSPLVIRPSGSCIERITEAEESSFIEAFNNGTLQYFSAG